MHVFFRLFSFDSDSSTVQFNFGSYYILQSSRDIIPDNIFNLFPKLAVLPLGQKKAYSEKNPSNRQAKRDLDSIGGGHLIKKSLYY